MFLVKYKASKFRSYFMKYVSKGHTYSDVEATKTPCYWLDSAKGYYFHVSVTMNLTHIHIFTEFVSSYIYALYLAVSCVHSMLLWVDGNSFH